MAKMQCKTCDGVYNDVLSDGTRYFHACGPVWDGGKEAYVERANKRDENIQVTGYDKAGTATTTAKSDGLGATKV